jgi:hypothetical protein
MNHLSPDSCAFTWLQWSSYIGCMIDWYRNMVQLGKESFSGKAMREKTTTWYLSKCFLVREKRYTLYATFHFKSITQCHEKMKRPIFPTLWFGISIPPYVISIVPLLRLFSMLSRKSARTQVFFLLRETQRSICRIPSMRMRSNSWRFPIEGNRKMGAIDAGIKGGACTCRHGHCSAGNTTTANRLN